MSKEAVAKYLHNGDPMKSNQKVIEEIKDELDTLKDNLKGSFSKSGEALSENAKLLMDNTLDIFKQRINKLTEMAKEKGENVDEMVRSNPWKVAGIALAAGFLIGFVSRRPKN